MAEDTRLATIVDKEVDREFARFIEANNPHLVNALEQDYDELPNIPSYHAFVDRLRPKMRDLAEEHGLPKSEADRVIDWYDGMFYRYTLPSLRR